MVPISCLWRPAELCCSRRTSRPGITASAASSFAFATPSTTHLAKPSCRLCNSTRVRSSCSFPPSPLIRISAAREIDRKAYLRSLLSRTPAQIAEEDFLYIESRRLEQAYNKITVERADLLKILGGREGIGAHGGVQVGVGGGVKGASNRNEKDAERKRKGQTGWEIEGLNGGGLPDGWAGEGSKRKATPAQGTLQPLLFLSNRPDR